MRYEIDIHAVMQHIPEIMGLELTWRKDAWEGRYYLNGERHPYKRDKLKVKFWKNNGKTYIMAYEQGGKAMSLENWLQAYGGCPDWKTARDVMRGFKPCAIELHGYGSRSYNEVKYVEREVLEKYRGYDLGTCTLFNWMCRMFGEKRVREVWDAYKVTTNERGEVVYWYTDAEGRIVHDKVMRYSMNGHRDKQFITRKFKTADCYTGRAYYGAHLVEEDKKVVLMESEKSVLLCACHYGLDYGAVFLATGGKGNVRDIDERTWLAPDIDAIETWSAIEGAQIYEWWNEFKGTFDGHDDIGDAIVRKVMGDYRGGERYL